MDYRFKTEFYINDKGESPVEDFLKNLSKRANQKFTFKNGLLKSLGFMLQKPHCKYISGDIYELRFKGDEGQIRIFYFCLLNNRFVYLHGLCEEDSKNAKERV